MPPIQIQLNSPINAAKAPSPTKSSSTLNHTTGPSTPARPSAAASAYAPMGASTPQHAPFPSPTKTTTLPPSESPPPPQPGAVPLAPPPASALTPRASLSAAGHSRNTSTASASSRKGSTAALYTPANPFVSSSSSDTFVPPPAGMPSFMPPQYTIPPPQSNYAPTDSTATPPFTNPSYAAPSSAYEPPKLVTPPQAPEGSAYFTPAYTYGAPSVPASGAGGLAHPTGYQQNPYADAMSPAARAAQAAEQRRPSMLAGLAEVVGVGGGGNDTGEVRGSEDGAWGAAKKWMGGVADKAVEIEGEVWRRFSTVNR